MLIWIIIILIAIIILYPIFTYNAFIRLRNRVKEAASDIEVQLKRRYDLIPNVIETVKGYAAHEKQVFEMLRLLALVLLPPKDFKKKPKQKRLFLIR